MIVCCLVIGGITISQLKNSKQVDFISTFVSSVGQTDVFDSGNNVKGKLYDESIIKSLYDFGWYHATSVHLKDIHSVGKDKTKEITDCIDYLSKTYPLINIEAYEVHLESALDTDKPTTIKKSSYDVFYLAIKDEKYYLLYTQTLFENSKESVKAVTSGQNDNSVVSCTSLMK